MNETIKDILNPKHLHWKFLGYKDKDAEGRLMAFSEITIIDAKDEQTALLRAKEILTRPNYHLQSVWECNTCRMQKEQEKLFKKLLKDYE